MSKNKKFHILIEQIVSEELGAILASEDKLLDAFKKLRGLEGKLEYARKHFPEIGEGSSRQVFALPSGKALKVALNEKGVAQNEVEKKVSTNGAIAPIHAKVLAWDSTTHWLIVERVNEFRELEEFGSAVGIDHGTFYRVISLYRQHRPSSIDDLFFPTYLQQIRRYILGWMQKEKADREIEALETPSVRNFLKRVVTLLERGIAFADLTAIHHWGTTSDGRVVVLDYGADWDVMIKHYGTPERFLE